MEHIKIQLGAMFQGMEEKLLEYEYNTTTERATDDQSTEEEKKSGESVSALMFIRKACTVRHSELGREIQNDFLKNKSSYPSDVTGA